jgi:uncharacterized membrane protein YbhN (UPF0104 family)
VKGNHWLVTVAALSHLALLFVLVGLAGFAAAASQLGMAGLASVLGLALAGFLLRFLRWHACLAAMSHSLDWGKNLRVFLAGLAIGARSGLTGDTRRGILLKPLGVPYGTSRAAVLSERLTDLIAIVLLALIALSAYEPARPIVALGFGVVLLSMAVIAHGGVMRVVVLRLSGPTRIGLFIGHLTDTLEAAGRCLRPGPLLLAVLLGLVAWGAQALAFHALLQGLNLPVSLQVATFILALAVLAGAISFVPAGLGLIEASLFVLLSWRGVGPADAAAVIVMFRLVTLWFGAVLSAAAVEPLAPQIEEQ